MKIKEKIYTIVAVAPMVFFLVLMVVKDSLLWAILGLGMTVVILGRNK